MEIASQMITHQGGVTLHTLSQMKDRKFPTLAFLPGMSGNAEGGFEALGSVIDLGFNLASLSFRGRGQSSTPSTGYSFDDHANDLEFFLNTLGAPKVVLIANSISTIYSVQYLLRKKPNPVVGLIIVDHPLRVRKLREGWTEDFSQMTVDGKSVLLTMRKLAIQGVERDSEAVDYYNPFAELKLPTLVMAAPVGKGILTEMDLLSYGRQENTKIVSFKDSGHMIRLSEPEKYCATILEFVKNVG